MAKFSKMTKSMMRLRTGTDRSIPVLVVFVFYQYPSLPIVGVGGPYWCFGLCLEGTIGYPFVVLVCHRCAKLGCSASVCVSQEIFKVSDRDGPLLNHCRFDFPHPC